ncbi:winged helix-turn-helix transcriptional regulator [Leeia sp.]|uniref:winged helix-turn-helix transcriptional regulator n=1 Tax=Leeia sp. TaxID=2884678 RepID=UPI0035B1578B
MHKADLGGQHCPIAQTLEQVGEWWSLLIVRNLFCGMSRFDALQQHLGISSNILAARLKRLTTLQIVQREADPQDGRAWHYRLTEKGQALAPLLAAMVDWGEAWMPHPAGRRIRLIERQSRQVVRPVQIFSQAGVPLAATELDFEPGPAADASARALAEAARTRR